MKLNRVPLFAITYTQQIQERVLRLVNMSRFPSFLLEHTIHKQCSWHAIQFPSKLELPSFRLSSKTLLLAKWVWRRDSSSFPLGFMNASHIVYTLLSVWCRPAAEEDHHVIYPLTQGLLHTQHNPSRNFNKPHQSHQLAPRDHWVLHRRKESIKKSNLPFISFAPIIALVGGFVLRWTFPKLG